MSITGNPFELALVSPNEDASLFDWIGAQSYVRRGVSRGYVMDGRRSDFNISTVGLVATIQPGEAYIQGRRLALTQAIQIPIPPNRSGYICAVVDLARTNTSEGSLEDGTYEAIINQAFLDFIPAGQQLVWGNLHSGDTLAQLPLYNVTTSTTTITNSEDVRPFKNDHVEEVTDWNEIEPVNLRMIQGETRLFKSEINADNSPWHTLPVVQGPLLGVLTCVSPTDPVRYTLEVYRSIKEGERIATRSYVTEWGTWDINASLSSYTRGLNGGIDDGEYGERGLLIEDWNSMGRVWNDIPDGGLGLAYSTEDIPNRPGYSGDTAFGWQSLVAKWDAHHGNNLAFSPHTGQVWTRNKARPNPQDVGQWSSWTRFVTETDLSNMSVGSIIDHYQNGVQDWNIRQTDPAWANLPSDRQAFGVTWSRVAPGASNSTSDRWLGMINKWDTNLGNLMVMSPDNGEIWTRASDGDPPGSNNWGPWRRLLTTEDMMGGFSGGLGWYNNTIDQWNLDDQIPIWRDAPDGSTFLVYSNGPWVNNRPDENHQLWSAIVNKWSGLGGNMIAMTPESNGLWVRARDARVGAVNNWTTWEKVPTMHDVRYGAAGHIRDAFGGVGNWEELGSVWSEPENGSVFTTWSSGWEANQPNNDSNMWIALGFKWDYNWGNILALSPQTGEVWTRHGTPDMWGPWSKLMTERGVSISSAGTLGSGLGHITNWNGYLAAAGQDSILLNMPDGTTAATWSTNTASNPGPTTHPNQMCMVFKYNEHRTNLIRINPFTGEIQTRHSVDYAGQGPVTTWGTWYRVPRVDIVTTPLDDDGNPMEDLHDQHHYLKGKLDKQKEENDKLKALILKLALGEVLTPEELDSLVE